MMSQNDTLQQALEIEELFEDLEREWRKAKKELTAKRDHVLKRYAEELEHMEVEKIRKSIKE